MKYGPYPVRSTIPEDAMVGVNTLLGQLYVVVGEFAADTTSVPGHINRQDIDATGKVLTEVYGGPPISARVMNWSKIHD